MRWFLLNGIGEIVVEAVQETFAMEGLGVVPGTVTAQPDADALERWRETRSAHYFWVLDEREILPNIPAYIAAELAHVVRQEWLRRITPHVYDLGTVRLAFPALTAAWSAGDDRARDAYDRYAEEAYG